MELTKDKVFLIKEVFSKMRYDKMLEEYQIPLEAYIPLKLTPKQRKLLEQMCIDNNIQLVKVPEKLSNSETMKLLEKYQQLKNKLDSITTLKEKEKIESQMYEVRNIIAEGHMELVIRIILRYFPNIMNREDKEDIYQIGYEVLLLFIDKFDLNKGDYFERFLYKYLIPYINRRISLVSDDLSIDDNTNLANLIKKRKIFKKKYNREPTILELQEILNMNQEEIEKLLIIEERINTTSIYEEELDLVDDSFDEIVADTLSRESVRKIINTLPEMQRKCLLLYFGFGDKPYYTYDEIAAKFNISHEGARKSVLDGLENLNKLERKQVLNALCYVEMESDTLEKTGVRQSIHLFYFLLRQMPKGLILELMDNLSKKNREALALYLGLVDGIEYTRKEIAKKLGVTISSINDRMKTIYDFLTILIDQMYKEKYKGTERETFDLLSNMLLDYINNSNIRVIKNKR